MKIISNINIIIFFKKLIFLFFLYITISFFYVVCYAKQVEHIIKGNLIKIVAYQPDTVVLVHASTFASIQIFFGKNEIIKTIQNGDLAAWLVNVPEGLNNMLFLKPTIFGSNTNMIVVTNQHTYYFHLICDNNTISSRTISTYAIHFIYPKKLLFNSLSKEQLSISEKKIYFLNRARLIKKYNWDYSFSGTQEIMPLHVFDDGQFTYMQLQAKQSIPAIFSVDNVYGKENIVNYRINKDYLIIQQVYPQFTLRKGKYQVTSIFNNKLIKQIKNHEKR